MERTMNGAALRELWLASGGDAGALDAVTLTGAEPALPSSFAVGTAAQASIAAATLAAREIGRGAAAWRRTWRSTCAMRRSIPQRTLSAHRRPHRARAVGRAAGLYRTGDGGHVRLHTNFAHHRDGVLALLG